jgi:hypothetical protein
MITFLSQPDYVQPGYGNLVFQFESTGATDPTKYKFRYVVDVFSNEGFLTTLKITPSTEGWGQCDLSPILLNYTSSQPLNVGCSGETPLHQSAWGYLNDNMIVYSIKVGEEYATTQNGIVVGYDGEGGVGAPSVLSNICYSYNGVKEWFNGKSFDFQLYWLTGSTGTFPQYTSRFLTNSPRSRYARTTDYYNLAALNWWKETGGDFSTPINSSARQIYSALFKFYDSDNNLLQTSRSYNTEDLCGTRPNCSWYDFWFDLPTNYAEQQVVYLGCGVPQIENYHGISVPTNTKYYSVELEGTQAQPTPPEPEIDDFDGCSCHNYSYQNLFDESAVIFTYLDCTGGTQTIQIDPLASETWCACQNSNVPNIDTERAIDLGLCEVCDCYTYDITNLSEFPALFSYTTCEGDSVSQGIGALETLRVCACQGSVEAGGMTIVEVGECPLPFVADCHRYSVSYSAATPYTFQYTGCCGSLQSVVIPPSTSLFIIANNPLPSTPGITATDFGTFTGFTCPEEVIPLPTSFSGGTCIIGRNVCDDTLQYFRYSGDPIFEGTFVQFENTIYEVMGEGGGCFIPLENPLVFINEAQAISAFPCPTYSAGTCLTTTIISEPFYFYLDGECSRGDRMVYFMNTFGAWDSYNFRQKEDTGYSVEKQTYQSSPELYSQGWDTNSYYGWNSRRNVYNNLVKKSGVLYTDFLPQAESIWLSKELFQSPSVYMLGDDGVLEPIVITNAEVVVPNYQINTIQYQIEITYQSAYDTLRQTQE